MTKETISERSIIMNTVTHKDIFDFAQWRESTDIEFKLAAGKDGVGALPNSIWETYSAMANTTGGTIFLGVKEKSDLSIEVKGVESSGKIIKDFWNQINNPQKVSCNLLTSDHVCEFQHKGKTLISITIPRATRRDRPVYIGANPMTGTYWRQNDGDYHCPTEVIQRMIAEKTSDTLDAGICNHYTLDDIDLGSLTAYRQMFSNRTPVHPFNEMDNLEFLRNLGGWRENRESGEKGLTYAGLLMFGKLRSILDIFPKYIVDYREYGRMISEEQRWEDRITTDFSWSGNLFSFCKTVLPRLYQSLKVPFKLEHGIRVDESPVHIALREALVNTLIHADYGEGGTILVVKRPDLFGFRNPGVLRISKEDAIRGGTMNSDCRNRNLQKMFQMIGYADQAGSGFPKIYSGWASQDWKKPEFREDFKQKQTYLALRMTSLFPEDVVTAATEKFGERFSTLSQLERLAVVTAIAEEEVSHSRLMELTTAHQADISAVLRKLVDLKILHSDGYGRGMVYHICGTSNDECDLFNSRFSSSLEKGPSSLEKGPSSPEKGPSSPEKGPSSPEKGPSSPEKGPSSELERGGCQPLPKLNKIKKDCLSLFLTYGELSAAELRTKLKRNNPAKFRNNILSPLMEIGFVVATLQPPQHPKQKYKMTDEGRAFMIHLNATSGLNN
jgi:predicted HTH transcriptional regulator